MISSVVRHEVSFWHGPDRLVGELRLPGAPGPHPALVVVREPQQPERDHSPWLDVLAGVGIASFTWDRPRPCDLGRGPRRPIAHHAREVLAAVERLACRGELDPRAIAVLGWGEGGWVAAQATTYSHHLAALILACTPLAGPEDGGHDPRPTVSAVTVPVLALFGEQDPCVPLEGSVSGLRAALRGAGHTDHEVAVVRGADHGLRVRAPHGLGPLAGGRYRFGDWPPGLTRLLAGWLDRTLRPDAVPVFPPPSRAATAGPGPVRAAGACASAAVSAGTATRPPSVAARALPVLPPAVPVRQVRRRVAR